MIVAAIADLDDFGMDLEPFWEIIRKVKEPDILLLGGDIYEYRSPEIYGLFLDFIKLRKWECPIIAVFGNREFDEDVDDIKKICKKRITFLDDESFKIKIKNEKVGIVGTRGSLDIPTWWQWKNVSGIKKTYKERVELIRNLLNNLETDIKILLSHYSPTYKTLKGEDPRIFGGLGSEKYEKVLVDTKTTFAVHGHAEYGTPLAFVDSIPIFNVSFNINKKIVEIDTNNLPRSGLKRFI